jgi:hypothetical protein
MLPGLYRTYSSDQPWERTSSSGRESDPAKPLQHYRGGASWLDYDGTTYTRTFTNSATVMLRTYSGQTPLNQQFVGIIVTATACQQYIDHWFNQLGFSDVAPVPRGEITVFGKPPDINGQVWVWQANNQSCIEIPITVNRPC